MKHPTRRLRRLSWLLAALSTAALFAAVFALMDVRYITSDDSVILRAFNGYETGTPATFNIYTHGLLAYPLSWLGRLDPLVPWFSYVQLGLMALAMCVVQKSVMQCFAKAQKPLWAGFIAAVCVLVCFGVKYTARPTYTQTAALLGAAAVLQVMSADPDATGGRGVFGTMLGATALLALAYALRQLTALVVLAVCGAAFLWIFMRHYWKQRSLKPLVASLLAAALVMGSLAVWREAEIRLKGMQEHLAWQDARIRLVDYHDLTAIPQDVLDEVNWTPATLQMVQNWCFLDPDISTEAFTTVRLALEAQDTRTTGQRLQDAINAICGVNDTNPQDVRLMMLGAIAAAAVLVGALWQRKGRVLGALALAALLLAGMLLYLGLQGRMPLRALLMAALPPIAMVLGLVPEAIPPRRGGTALLCVLLAALAVHTALAVQPVVNPLLKSEEYDAAYGSAMGDLEEYALTEPESFFVFDLTLSGADIRMFPRYTQEEGMPHNITFWGGWNAHSPENTQLFANYGFDLNDLSAEMFLQDNVYIASGRLDPPPVVIADWVAEETGMEVECMVYSEWGTVILFQLYAY